MKTQVVEWLADKWFDFRASRYLASHPSDYVAVLSIKAGRHLGARTARDNAELTAGRRLSDLEWSRFGGQWEHAWERLVR